MTNKENDSSSCKKRKLTKNPEKQIPKIFKTVKEGLNAINTTVNGMNQDDIPCDSLKTKLQVIPCIDCRNNRDVRYHANTMSKQELDNWYQMKFSIKTPCSHVNAENVVDDEEYKTKINQLTIGDKVKYKKFFRAAVDTLIERKKIDCSNKLDAENSANVEGYNAEGYTELGEKDIEFDELNSQLKTHQWWRVFVADNEAVSGMQANDIESLLRSKSMIAW